MKKIIATQREIQEACKKQVHRDKSKYHRPSNEKYHFSTGVCPYCKTESTFSDSPDHSFDGWIRCGNCGGN